MAEEEKLLSRMDQNNGNKEECRTRRSCDTFMSGSDELRHRLPTKNDRTSNEETMTSRINMREYAQQLAPWIYNYRMWAAMSSFPPTLPYQMMSCLPFGGQQSFTPPMMNTPGFVDPQIGSVQAAQNQRQTVNTPQEQTANRIGREFVIPPLWKRVLAELIDFIVLFYLKIIIMIIVMRQMGILKTENVLNVHIDVVPYFDLKNMEMDIDKAFTMTSEIIALEIVNRIMITLFETFCLRKGIGTHGGATPGKRLLGMCVVSCDNIMDLGNGKVIVIPAGDVGFINALVRSVIKNFTLAFFFPACFTVFFFQHNRAAYDILGKTIVVQNPRPNHR